MKFPKKQIYLLHGNDESNLNNDRCEVVDAFLIKEERGENYKEFSPKGTKTRVNLSEILPELLMELGTISFFPNSRRVVVVYNLDELYGAKRSSSGAASKKDSDKKTRKSDKPNHEARLIEYLEKSLPVTNNVIIFQSAEDAENNLRVKEQSPLYKTISKHGHIIEHTVMPLAWQLENTIKDRDLKSALNIRKIWYMKDSDGASNKIFYSLLRSIVLLLQAKVIDSKRKQRMPLEQIRHVFFPSEIKYNILGLPPKVRSYIEEASKNYTIAELNAGLDKLLLIGCYVYPRTTDLYVPDLQLLFDKFLIEFIGETKPKTKNGNKRY